MRKIKLIIIALLGATTLSYAQSSPQDSLAVAQTLNNFVTSFSNLDWPTFSSHFADKATAFFPPSARFPYRANNKTEILKIFSNVFEHARGARTAPPYIDIQPKELRIQCIGQTAIATFILNDPELLGRRSIILEKIDGRWLIVHLHASGVPYPTQK